MNELGFAPDVALAMKANLAVMLTLQSEIAVVERRLASHKGQAQNGRSQYCDGFGVRCEYNFRTQFSSR